MWLIASNPTSGRGKGNAITQEVANYLTARQIPYKTIVAGNAVKLAENLRNSARSATGIIAVGGDGLMHLTIQVAMEFNLPLAPIPAGTGNDFARALGHNPETPIEALWKAITSEPTNIDLGRVDGEYFGAVLSTGFDSLVNERANRLRWPAGPNKYNVAIAIELPAFKPTKYSFNIDGQNFSRDAMLIAIGNGNSYGGGMQVCPGARLDDGLFEVMILNPVSKFEFLRIFPKVYEGLHIQHPQVEIIKARTIQVSANAVAYADGERIGPLPISAEVVPKALQTWCA